MIDLHNIIIKKVGAKKARYVPKFFVRWLHNFLHLDEINAILNETEEKKLEGEAYFDYCLKTMGIDVGIEGEENMPAADDMKRYVFVSNHPLGGIDGLAIIRLLFNHYGADFRVLINEFLLHIPELAKVSYPINKTGRQSRAEAAGIDECFSGKRHAMLFPAADCSRRINGEIHDLPWRKMFINKSVSNQRDIVPLYFEGRNSNRFYSISNICDRLKMRFNISMIFLPDEMIRNRGQHFVIKVGKPIPWQTFDKSRTAQQWAKYVEQIVYDMK